MSKNKGVFCIKIVVLISVLLLLIGASLESRAQVVQPFQPQSDAIRFYKEGLAPLLRNGKWGFIDEQAKVIVEPQFDFVDDFSEGLAAVNVGGLPSVKAPTYPFEIDGGKWGYIDRKGRMAIKTIFDGVGQFREGLAPIQIDDDWGYIDNKGDLKIEPRFEQAEPFSNGLAEIAVGGKWGFIDKSGRVAVKPQFDRTYAFSEGLAGFQLRGKWGFIDKTGQIVIDPRFDFLAVLGGFYNGRAYVSSAGEAYYIDKTGNMFGDWDYFGGIGNTDYYYNSKTINRAKDSVKVWTKVVSKNDVDIMTTLYELDCPNKRVRYLSIVRYGIKGEIKASGSKVVRPEKCGLEAA